MKKRFLIFALFMLTSSVHGDETQEAQTTISEPPVAITEAAPEVISQAEPRNTQLPSTDITPSARQKILKFAETAPSYGAIHLTGVSPDGYLEFGVRSDEYVSKATLDLEFTPSPSLLPVESHLNVYLNDELMGVITLKPEDLGKKNQITIPIDPLFIQDFNHIKLSFIGHYREICENQANTTLWLDVSKSSQLNLTFQSLRLGNELAHFPEPFFDSRDFGELTLPMVFSQSPNLAQQKAAAILSSWFGTQVDWRKQNYPVYYDALPNQHSIVFATNKQKPAFLKQHPDVKEPTIEMLTHPTNPYIKLLLIMGRDDNDLITAVNGIARGQVIFRGNIVTINEVEKLIPREPYDAPKWVQLNKPIYFNTLQDYEGQLQSRGLKPNPITLNMTLPPDLFMFNNTGLQMQLRYRYTAPAFQDDSRMSISVNDHFIKAYPLEKDKKDNLVIAYLPLIQGWIEHKNLLNIPAVKLGERNQITFAFDYTNPIPGGSVDQCITYQPVPNAVAIDDLSSFNFTGDYRHYIALPDLRVYSHAGFPFSRYADLSETLVFVNQQPSPTQLSTLLISMGNIGAQTGYPALNVSLTGSLDEVQKRDADLLLIGTIPPALNNDKQMNVLIDKARSEITLPSREISIFSHTSYQPTDKRPDSRISLTSKGSMGAIIGFQSPFFSQRSVVALLADSTQGYKLLNEAISDSGKRDAMHGSVVLVRESGVNSLRVGDTYFVGYLPWWEEVWYVFASHPIWLGLAAIVGIILVSLLIWRAMKIRSQRRLATKD
ncbi:cellulose biosynthesis cyclic di-GMP-binding regulatory protein BcsB [Proteus columbae]|uniref:cellulose biosynthesis cyclic di-GMP-binding regulatory protein BcsB n=1 Tax=Proteus columbae TaxID=1987580 RepID=UPI00288B5D93|nr:cellulose biosynthesis cyclic di-GMP-binding regulatory protein BcsB [Proteus columbae]